MLSNLITIYGEHGHLITRSLLDDKLILKLNEEKTTISSSLQKRFFHRVCLYRNVEGYPQY